MLADIKPGAGGVDDDGTEELIEAFPPGEGTAKDSVKKNIKMTDTKKIFLI